MSLLFFVAILIHVYFQKSLGYLFEYALNNNENLPKNKLLTY